MEKINDSGLVETNSTKNTALRTVMAGGIVVASVGASIVSNNEFVNCISMCAGAAGTMIATKNLLDLLDIASNRINSKLASKREEKLVKKLEESDLVRDQYDNYCEITGDNVGVEECKFLIDSGITPELYKTLKEQGISVDVYKELNTNYTSLKLSLRK